MTQTDSDLTPDSELASTGFDLLTQTWLDLTK